MTASQTCISDLSSMSHSFLAVDSCIEPIGKSPLSVSQSITSTRAARPIKSTHTFNRRFLSFTAHSRRLLSTEILQTLPREKLCWANFLQVLHSPRAKIWENALLIVPNVSALGHHALSHAAILKFEGQQQILSNRVDLRHSLYVYARSSKIWWGWTKTSDIGALAWASVYYSGGTRQNAKNNDDDAHAHFAYFTDMQCWLGIRPVKKSCTIISQRFFLGRPSGGPGLTRSDIQKKGGWTKLESSI